MLALAVWRLEECLGMQTPPGEPRGTQGKFRMQGVVIPEMGLQEILIWIKI